MSEVSVLAQLPSSAYVKAELRERKLRPAMWVMAPGGVGILTGLRDGVAAIMLTDEAGADAGPVLRQAAFVRQAYYDEIPAPRRPAQEEAEAMGYTTRTD